MSGPVPDGPMSALWEHWGSAYIITHHEPGEWIAQRRDTGATLKAETAPELHELIIADYTTSKVSRDVAP